MLGDYRRIFTQPGTLSFCLAGLGGRATMSTLGLGIVVMLSTAPGRYALAGAVSATYMLSTAAIGPLLGRFSDRYGQAAALRTAAAALAAGVAGLVGCAAAHAPAWTLFTASAVTGCGVPPTGAMVRTRWAMLYSGTQHLHTAYSLEAALDEVVFMTGPVMIAVTADLNRNVPLLAVSGLSIGGLGWLAAQRRTQPPVDHTPRRNTPRSIKRVWPAPGIAVLFVCAVGIGGMLGAADLAVLATGSGHLTEAGLIIALWAASSAIGGVISGAFQGGVRVLGRVRIGTTVLWLFTLPLIAFSGLGPAAVILFFAGFALAPTVSAMNLLAETRTTDQTLTEGLSWITSGITLGATAGTVIAGWATDRVNPVAAFATASVFSAIAMICAWAATTSDSSAEIADQPSRPVDRTPSEPDHPPRPALAEPMGRDIDAKETGEHGQTAPQEYSR